MKNIIAAVALALIAQPASATTFRLTLPQMDGITAGKYVAPDQMINDVWNYWNNNKKTWGKYKLTKDQITVRAEIVNGERIVYLKNYNAQFATNAIDYIQRVRQAGKEWRIKQGVRK